MTPSGTNVGKELPKEDPNGVRRRLVHQLVDEQFDEAWEKRSHGKLGHETSFDSGVAQQTRELKNVVHK